MIDNTSFPVLNKDICSGCGRCVAACPEKLFALETVGFHKTAVIIHPEQCKACRLCVGACPTTALL